MASILDVPELERHRLDALLVDVRGNVREDRHETRLVKAVIAAAHEVGSYSPV
ncbi:hypothetical protein Q9189_007040 [Teloschistes chrysophthalmus]